MTWLTRMHLRTWQHQMTTIMQPFQCDLQPQIQETQRTTHTGTTTRCRTQRRNRLNSKRSKPHPPHTRGTFHRRLKPLYTEKHKVSCSGFLPKRKPMQHSCSHYNAFYSMTWLTRMHLRTWQHQMTTIMQPFQCDLQPQIQETHRTTHTGTTTRCRTQRRNRLNSKRSKPHPPHTRGTFHRRLTQLYTEKHKVSCSGFLPKRKPMQHSCSHYNAFYSMTWLTRMHLRTWQHQMTTIMQPFQCDLQPQIQETHRTTHTGTTTGCRTQRRNRLNSKRSKPHPPHTRGTFHRRLKPLYTEKHKVSCSGFLPKRKPMQHSCSHYNAFYSMTWLTRMHLRTWQHQMTTIMQPFQCDLQLQIQETHRTTHTGTTTRCRTQRRNRLNSKRSKPHPPHTRGTFHRRLKPLYTEKHKVSCSGFLPKRKPMQHSCSHYNAFYSMTWLTRMHLRTWQHQMTTIMQPFQCDLQPQIQETHRTTHTGTTTRCRTQRRNRLNSKRSKPHPPHTRGTFHRRLTQLYTEKYKVSCSGFLPKRKPMQHSCSHYNAFYSMTWLTRMHLRTWQHQMTTIMQPFQCDLQLQIQETHRTTHTGTTTGCRTQRRNRLNSKRSKPHPPHTRGTFHRRLKPLYTEKYKVSCSGFLPKRKPMQHSCSHYNAFYSMTWLTRMHLRTWQHQMTTIMQPFQCDLQPQIQETHRTTHTGTTTRCRTQRRNRLNSKRSKPHPPHTRGTFHRRLTQLYTEKYKVSCSGFLPKRKPMQHSCSHYNAFYSMTWLTRMHLRTWQHQMTTIMQPFQCDLQLQIQETHRTTHTGTTTGCRTQRRNRLNSKRSKPHPPHTRGTFHRRLKPLYTEKCKVSCSGFLPKTKPLQHHAPLPFMVASSLPHHSPSSSLPFFTTSLLHHFPSSPLPFVTTPLHHHFPSSPLPFVTTSLLHHFPSSPLPFVTTPLHHHFPSSPLPFVTTSLLHHFPSSPLPFVTTPLHHHFPSSPLPFVTTSLAHHFPSSPLPFLTTPLHHHFPSSPLPFLTTSLPHHFPSSPPCVIASYSFVVYC